jgi:hypothetical protein
MFFVAIRDIAKYSWFLAFKMNVSFIHWHLGYGWDEKDYKIIWKELHKAHRNYGRKINKKYGRRIIYWNSKKK